MTAETVRCAVYMARWARARQERRMGWPREDWAAFLRGDRDHWPSMQAAITKATDHAR